MFSRCAIEIGAFDDSQIEPNTTPIDQHLTSAENVMAPNLRLNAVAFISPQNHPILIRTFAKQDEHAIKYHYIAHTSLDVIEERGQHHASPPSQT